MKVREPAGTARARRARGLARVLGALAAVGLALLSGCATTRPWQREILARDVMALDPDPAAFALEQHLLGTREGAVGGFGGGGGGCGCN